MVKRVLLMGALVGLSTTMLVGCAHKKKPVPHYRCLYVNAHTHRSYSSVGLERKASRKMAWDACRRGPFNWRCHYKGCQKSMM